jgi:replicative DNA helicase
MSKPIPNADADLEWAMAAEAVYAHERFMALAVGAEDFAFEEPKLVADAAHEAWEVDGVVSLETVSKALQRGGKLSRLGGPTGLAEKLHAPAVPDVERLVELRRLRAVQAAAQGVQVAAERGDLQAALAALGDAQTTALDAGRVQVVEGYEMGARQLERLQQRRHATALVHPGFAYLEQAAGSLPLGGMTVLGGSTNVGKSGFVLELMVRAAERSVVSGYVSCEDAEPIVSARFASVFAGVSSRKILTGTLDDREWPRVGVAHESMREMRGRTWFTFAVGGSDVDVCAAMSRCAMQGAKIVIVDYVQAVESSKRQQDRRNEIRWLSARLKAHAQRLNVHLVLVSQFSRPTKGDEHKEPTKYDLKEAGDLENAADYVLLLWREREDDFADVRVKLAKSKIGNVGATWKLARNERTARLEEVDGSYQSAADRRKAGRQ